MPLIVALVLMPVFLFGVVHALGFVFEVLEHKYFGVKRVLKKGADRSVQTKCAPGVPSARSTDGIFSPLFRHPGIRRTR